MTSPTLNTWRCHYVYYSITISGDLELKFSHNTLLLSLSRHQTSDQQTHRYQWFRHHPHPISWQFPWHTANKQQIIDQTRKNILNIYFYNYKHFLQRYIPNNYEFQSFFFLFFSILLIGMDYMIFYLKYIPKFFHSWTKINRFPSPKHKR